MKMFKMKVIMKANLVVLFLGLLLVACEPISQPQDQLLGDWKKINDENYIVSISDSLMRINIGNNQVCHYTKDENKLYIKRLWFSESHPSYNAECNYSIKGDTLLISEFEMLMAATYPPQFNDVTLIRVKP